jgi:hypothetical protein
MSCASPLPVRSVVCSLLAFLAPAGVLLAAEVLPVTAAGVSPAAAADAKGAAVMPGPFGIGSDAMHTKDHPKWIPQMTAIGIDNLRSCGGHWAGVEAEPGTWTWNAIDERLTFLEAQGVRSGITLIGVPKWAKQDKRGLPLGCLPQWSEYVTQVVTHTKGRVELFEVWNEPPNGTGNATPEDYAKVVVASYDAAKAANPAAKIGLAAKSAYLYYLDAALVAGAKGHYDYITLHPYEILGSIVKHPGLEPIYLGIAAKVRKMLAARDPAKIDVPIIFTELGFDAKHGTEQQAQAVVKAYAMGIAQGISCIQWFEGIDGDSGPMGLMDAKAKPRPAYTALAQLIQHLGKHPGYLGWLLLNDQHYAFAFQGAAGPVLATWAATSAPDTVDFSQAVRLVDPTTGTITESATTTLSTAPILVLGVPDKLLAQAAANKAKPFTWCGDSRVDYRSAKSVSITMGTKNIERGLHTQSGDAIAADVILYGGNARAGNVPGGNVYMVDPNFLSYDTVPIEITALVRRNEKNDPFKLTLEYESTSGYKKPEPFEIPEGQEWQKATWKITDPQFVSSWAFDFRFNSGKYSIQSVTVTRLDR